MSSHSDQKSSRNTLPGTQLVASPCVDICALDDNDVCMGCYRHGNEISQWGGYSNEQKRIVLQRCEDRYRGSLIPFIKPKEHADYEE